MKEHGSSVGMCLSVWLDGESTGILRSGGPTTNGPSPTNEEVKCLSGQSLAEL